MCAAYIYSFIFTSTLFSKPSHKRFNILLKIIVSRWRSTGYEPSNLAPELLSIVSGDLEPEEIEEAGDLRKAGV